MSDSSNQPDSPATSPGTASSGEAIFSSTAEEPSHRGLIVGILAIAVAAIVAGLLIPRGQENATTKTANVIVPVDSYAKSLVFSQLAMSQSSSFSGGTSTFLDGHIRNSGSSTVTAATAQVIFRNDVGLSPQVEVLPFSIIRTRQPYIDTEPVSAAPIKPGDDVEFRLIFESIPENWNQQMPEIQVIQATLR